MTDFPALLRTLSTAGVEYILVGGAAATAHGGARLTVDIDVLYRRTSENIDRVVAALDPHHPYRRGAPAGLPFRWHRATTQPGFRVS